MGVSSTPCETDAMLGTMKGYDKKPSDCEGYRIGEGRDKTGPTEKGYGDFKRVEKRERVFRRKTVRIKKLAGLIV